MKTFEDWYTESKWLEDNSPILVAHDAWDYQQERIDKLETENNRLENLPLCNLYDRDACVAEREKLEAENAQLVKRLDLHKLNHEHGEALTDLSHSIGIDE